MEPSLSCSDDVVGFCLPGEGFWVGGIVLGNEAVNDGLKVDDRFEDPVFEPATREFCEETFYGVEPRARCRREVECPTRMAVEPSSDLIFFVRRIVVENHMDGLVSRHFTLDAVEEADKLLMAVSLHVLSNDSAVQHIERGEQRRRSMPLIVVGHRAGAALLHRQSRLSSVERLDLALFIDRQHHRMGWRRDVQPDDIGQFAKKVRIVGKLEVFPPVRRQTMALSDCLYRRGGNTGRLGHRAQRPMGRLVRRRILCQANDLGDTIRRNRSMAGRAGLIAKKSVDTFMHEPLLPTPDTGLGLARLGHYRRCATALAAQLDDASSPYMLLQALGVRDDRT